MSFAACSRVVQAIALVVAVAAGCTKVREQPMAQAAPVAPPEPVKVTKPVRRPAPTSAWTSRPAPAPAAPAALPAEAVGEGTPFSRAKLQAALEAALPGLNPCWPNGTVSAATIAFDATSAGKAENVKVTGASSPAQERCVADHLAGLKLPSFDGPPVGVQLPITVGIRGLTQPADPTAPAQATAAAPAPKLFVNP